MKSFLLKFALFGIAGFIIVYSPWGLQEHVVKFTHSLVITAGWLLQFFGAEVNVHGNILRIPGFAVEVRGICNGVEATLVLWAAVLAYPTHWKHKIAGLIIGFFAVQGLNTLRIISLLYLGAWNREWFEIAHAYLWEMLIMLDILIFFLVWLRFQPSPANCEVAS